MVSPALSAVDKELRFSSEVELVMALSIFVLGYSFGPLFLSPMSELYGRVRVTQIANILFIVFNLACGFVKTPTQLIILRFVSGLGGSATLGVRNRPVAPSSLEQYTNDRTRSAAASSPTAGRKKNAAAASAFTPSHPH